MPLSFSQKQKNSKATALVVDGKLILSFPSAASPVLWQMDLNEVQSCAFEVIEGKDQHSFALVMKNPKGETIQIAPFISREQAIDGLLSASDALKNAHGKIRPANTSSGPSGGYYQAAHKPHGRFWLKTFGVLAGIIVFLMIVSAVMAPRGPGALQNTTGQENTGVNTARDAGIPMSADDFLRAQ